MLAEAIALVMLVALLLYALLAGADFGGGVWDLLAFGPRASKQRQLIARAIGPIWEANHVWLILIIVLMFTCFPVVFAALSIALHIPFMMMLIGIVLRGSAFAFRSYDERSASIQQRWGAVFAIASAFTPILLGVCLGAVTAGPIFLPDSRFPPNFLSSWTKAFPWAVGMFTLALFSFLAAIYLVCETDERELQEDFRTRGILSGLALGLCASVVLLLARESAPQLWASLVEHPAALALQALTAVFAVGAIAALYRRRYLTARFLAACQIVFIVAGWGWAQHPYLARPQFDLRACAAPDNVLSGVLIALGAGALVLFPSLYLLYRVFKGSRAFAVTERAANAE